MTPVEAQKLVTVLVTNYPEQMAKLDKAQQEDTMATYRSMLLDLPYVVGNAAVEQLMATADKFMPRPAALRSRALSLMVGERRQGGEAWGDIRKLRGWRERAAMADVDPIVMQICTSFDWVEWRTLWRGGADIEQWHVVTGDNETADRARFIELYDQLASQRRQEQLTASLPATKALRAAQERAALAAGESRTRQELPAGNAIANVMRQLTAGAEERTAIGPAQDADANTTKPARARAGGRT